MPITTDPDFIAAVEQADTRLLAEFALAFMAFKAFTDNRPYCATAGSASKMRAEIHRVGLKVPGFGGVL